jgi:crotonobetainyl-CoA:carnitine CoA-transferase CaiB-like acyl-CoA transferase
MRGRLQHNDELTALIAAWAAERPREEIYHRAGRELAPVAYVHTLADLYRSPQLQARRYIRSVDHPIAGTQTHPGPPFRTPEDAGTPGPAPLLGQHNAEVYGEWLGLSQRDLVRLRQAGVV